MRLPDRHWKNIDPDLPPAELHAVIAHWLYHLSRHHGEERRRRAKEAIAAISAVTDWPEWTVRRAMQKVAEDLSPKAKTVVK